MAKTRTNRQVYAVQVDVDGAWVFHKDGFATSAEAHQYIAIIEIFGVYRVASFWPAIEVASEPRVVRREYVTAGRTESVTSP